jgi:hypothetical protein
VRSKRALPGQSLSWSSGRSIDTDPIMRAYFWDKFTLPRKGKRSIKKYTDLFFDRYPLPDLHKIKPKEYPQAKVATNIVSFAFLTLFPITILNDLRFGGYEGKMEEALSVFQT